MERAETRAKLAEIQSKPLYKSKKDCDLGTLLEHQIPCLAAVFRDKTLKQHGK